MKFLNIILIGFLMLMIACQSPTNQQNVEDTMLEKQDTLVEKVEPPKPAIELHYPKKDGYNLITWKDLSYVTFEDRFNEEMQGIVMYPVFSDSIKVLEGQKIQIEGFIIPDTETDGNLHVLSGLPFSSCFFCGGAGPETVMDLQLKEAKKRFKTDKKMTFRGQLKLNETDLYYLNYILENAEVVK